MTPRSPRGVVCGAAAAAAVLLLGSVPLGGQAPGAPDGGTAALTGVVVDEITGEPLAGAAVILASRGRRVTTDEGGRFAFEGLEPGLVNARFEAPGYVAVVEEVELADAADFVQVWLERVDAVLDDILVLAGRRPPGAGSRADDVLTDPDRDRQSVLDLLSDQVPGVIVRRQGGVNGASSIRIRGTGSFRAQLSPDIYLDGVRLDTTTGDGRRAMSTLDLISAEEVARVRVLKGAAASAYGSSANGAIIIETKRGGGS